jgi:hypothetical protein
LTFLNKGTAEKEERVLEAGHLGFLRHLLFNSSASCQLTLVLQVGRRVVYQYSSTGRWTFS